MRSLRLCVRHVFKSESARLRELRLASLATDPDAFGGTYDRDAARPAAWWKRWCAESDDGSEQRTFVLVDDEGQWLGLTLVRRDHDAPGGAVLNGMWVAPHARGRRGALALTDACVSWAKARGLRELTLAVVAGSESALRAYRAAGFVVRGETTWSGAGRTLDELVMSRPV
jgi:RimJ/RimL family protein N-acetyltransferase